MLYLPCAGETVVGPIFLNSTLLSKCAGNTEKPQRAFQRWTCFFCFFFLFFFWHWYIFQRTSVTTVDGGTGLRDVVSASTFCYLYLLQWVSGQA